MHVCSHFYTKPPALNSGHLNMSSSSQQEHGPKLRNPAKASYPKVSSTSKPKEAMVIDVCVCECERVCVCVCHWLPLRVVSVSLVAIAFVVASCVCVVVRVIGWHYMTPQTDLGAK